MGCGGSKSTAVVESNVDVQRHSSVKRNNDVTIKRATVGEKVDDGVSNRESSTEVHTVATNEKSAIPINSRKEKNGDTTGISDRIVSDEQKGVEDGRKIHFSKMGQNQREKAPLKSSEGVQEKKMATGKSSESQKGRESQKKNAVPPPKGQTSQTKEGGSQARESNNDNNTSVRTKPQDRQNGHLAKENESKKVNTIVTKSNQTPLQSAPENIPSRLKTESPFDPSVKVEKYRKDPIPVFGRSAFPLSKDNPDLKVEDTFWPGKRALIPDYNKMKELDKHAIETPQPLRKDMDKLVAHLTKGTNTHLEKLRVVFRWVAHNTEYNVPGYKSGKLGDNSAETVLRTGLAVCAGYSNLLRAMCQKAGVQCEMINGYAKGAGYRPGSENLSKQTHSWNRVTLDGQTYLCDCTWAAGSVDTAFTRHWKEEEFLADPSSFANSHLPRDLSNHENYPYKSLEEWNNTPQFGHLAQFCSLKCLSHKDGVIKAPNNSCLMKFKLKRALYKTFCIIENEGGKKLKGAVQHWWNGNELCCSIRLPKAGRYSFVIIGSLSARRKENSNTEVLYPEHISDAITNSLVRYVIKATGSEKLNSMSTEENFDLFGAPLNLPDYGLVPVSKNDATIPTASGNAHLVFKKLHQGPSSISIELYKFEDQNKKLSSSVYCEQFDDLVVFHVRCPSPGRYSLIMYVKSDKEVHSCRMMYTVVCEGKFDPVRLPDMKGPSGPNARFEELGLRLKEAPSTTIVTSEGEGQLDILSDLGKGIKVIADLKDVSESPKKDGSYTVETDKRETEQVTTVYLRLNQKGFFKLSLFAKTESMSKHDYIGYWLVVCRKPIKTEQFPIGVTEIGPVAEFHSLCLHTTTQSRIVCENGEGNLDVFSDAKSNVEFVFKIKKGEEDEPESIGLIFADTYVMNAIRTTRFFIRMYRTGIFAFRLFAKANGSENFNYVGVFLVVNDIVCKKPKFPGRKTAYGPNRVFWDSGLDLDDGKSKRLELVNGEGDLCLTHKPGTKRRINAHLESSRDQDSATMLIEASWSDKGEITATRLRLRVQTPGVYDLVVFVENEKDNTFSFAGVWLVDCPKATTQVMFPAVRGTMGPSTKFFQMGLSTNSPRCSTLAADPDGTCTLQLIRGKPFRIVFKVSDKRCQVSETKSESGKSSVTVRVKLPGPGAYTLDSFASEENERTRDFVGKWLLEWN
ncbi:uncharacterized protein LOC129263700 [Lytechinus pictus]|uniref:uncharacterized protein LOC129263700 n=1 Tax=Lytechinus pictus TaxID=7653 RepID=UPI0030B9F22B